MKWGSGYWTKIVRPHRVIIWSWPPQIAFACLTKACSSLSDLHVLLKAWTENTTYWDKLTDSEFAKEERNRAAQISTGTLPPDKLRKTHSDKGKKCGWAQNTGQSIVSAPIIQSDDEEDDENEDDDATEDIHNAKRRRIEDAACTGIDMGLRVLRDGGNSASGGANAQGMWSFKNPLH